MPGAGRPGAEPGAASAGAGCDVGPPASAGAGGDTGAPVSAEASCDTRPPASAGAGGDTGAPVSAEASCDTRPPASADAGCDTGPPASAGAGYDTGAPVSAEASRETGPPASAEAGNDTGAPAPAPSVAYAPGLLAPLVTVAACVALAAATGARPELVGWLALTPVAVLLAVVDRRVHRLPDPLTLPLAAAAVLLLGGAALLPGHAGSWTSGLLGGLALGGFYFLLFLINPNGMGFGDVKLALALGVALGWYGWTVLFVGGFAGFLFGAAYGLALVLLRRAGRRTGIPFGPFMIGGALTGLLLGALAG
ncbi:prepilin peptidase [Streptomyces sp. NPDC017520]|uniref:prepilin peptidase n=1 Tax=Streptomyces sp. NPDC017520 TaxID=3364998 RepID=UPI0037B5E72F